MNAILQSADFGKELDLLVKVVSTKPSLPILANILVQAEGEGLRLAATDLQLGLVTFCPALVNEPGVTTLPAKHMSDIVGLLQGAITLTDNTLESGRHRSKIHTYPAGDFPKMPDIQDLPRLTIIGLQDAIRKVRFAVNEKEKRFFLDGALLSFTDTGFTLAATDGKRLAFVQKDLPKMNGWQHDPVILPSPILDKVQEMTGEVLFAIGEKQTFFVIDGRLLFSRMVDGKFPNYSSIIPRDNDCHVIFARTALQAVLKRQVLTADAVVCTFSPGTLTVRAESREIGQSSEHLDVQYTGVETAITLNGKYLLEFLNAAEGSSIALVWRGTGPLLFMDTDYQYVQLPLRNV